MKQNLDILIVENDTKQLSTIPQLKSKGHRVSTAANFYDALEILTKENLDAVMTDLMFPLGGDRMDFSLHDESQREEPAPLGYDFALRAFSAGVPLVAIVSDVNRHSGPLAAAYSINRSGKAKEVKTDGGYIFVYYVESDKSKLAIFNACDIELYRTPKGKLVRDYSHGCEGIKDWPSFLEAMRKIE